MLFTEEVLDRKLDVNNDTPLVMVRNGYPFEKTTARSLSSPVSVFELLKGVIEARRQVEQLQAHIASTIDFINANVGEK